jgi:hypothetical protein
MYNQDHLENMKAELATLQMESSKVKAHCNYLRNACHKIVNLRADEIEEEAAWIASAAVKQTEEQSLAHHDEMVVERFKQSFSKAE